MENTTEIEVIPQQPSIKLLRLVQLADELGLPFEVGNEPDPEDESVTLWQLLVLSASHDPEVEVEDDEVSFVEIVYSQRGKQHSLHSARQVMLGKEDPISTKSELREAVSALQFA